MERTEIPGFPGYLIDPDSSVWSLWEGRGSKRAIGAEPKRVTVHVNRLGYHTVSLRVGDKWQLHGVHRLLLLAFVGPCPEGYQACHGDGNPGRNDLSNLRWDSPRANHADSVRHGTAAYLQPGWSPHGSEIPRPKEKDLRAEYVSLSAGRRISGAGVDSLLRMVLIGDIGHRITESGRIEVRAEDCARIRPSVELWRKSGIMLVDDEGRGAMPDRLVAAGGA